MRYSLLSLCAILSFVQCVYALLSLLLCAILSPATSISGNKYISLAFPYTHFFLLCVKYEYFTLLSLRVNLRIEPSSSYDPPSEVSGGSSTPENAKTFDPHTQKSRETSFGDSTMSDEEGTSAAKAPVVAGSADLSGGKGDYREEEMDDTSGSELSELESSEVKMKEEEEEVEEWEGKSCGRPNYERATAGVGRQQSTPEFFRRGAQPSMSELNIFDRPGKTPMRGALARSLSVAAGSSPQQVGTAETLNPAKHFSEEGGMEGGAEGGVEGSKGAEGMEEAADEWAEEMADQSVGERPTTSTPTPTPVRWLTPTAVPVTPTKGNKRMAVGTPAPKRGRRPMRPAPIGFAAASALEQILGAVARVEKKMEEKVAALEARIVAGICARAAEVEEREKRLAVRLLALNGIETELAQKGQWEIKQWTDLAALLERRRVEIREIREAVAGLAQAAAAPEQAPAPAPIFSPPSTRERAPPGPTAPGAPQLMENVVATPAQEIGGEGDNMEGVEREGLFASQHAPALGESASAKQGGPGQEGIKKKKEKGKAKAAQIAEPEAPSRTPRRSAHQQRRQAALDAATLTGAASAVPRSILKRPETVEAEEKREKRRKAEAEKKEEEKAVARRRWEKWEKMTEAEQEAYSVAANPIKAMAYETETAEDAATNQQVAHKAGIRAVEEQWERKWGGAWAVPQQPSRPEMVEAERKADEMRREEVARRKVEATRKEEARKVEKVAARMRWEVGELSQEETATYDSAASPIKYLASDSEDLTEVAAGQRIEHMAGMRTLEDRWEENRALEEGPPAQLRP